MESPLNPILTDIFMALVHWNRHSTSLFVQTLYDWHFCALDLSVTVNQMLNKFSSTHPYVQFTTEMELNGEMAFPDVLVNRLEDSSV